MVIQGKVPIVGHVMEQAWRMDQEGLRALLHDRLRAPRVDDGLLEKAPEAGVATGARSVPGYPGVK